MAWNYFGIDWLAMVFTFVAIYLIGNKARPGFLVMMCGNTCWVAILYYRSQGSRISQAPAHALPGRT